MIGILMRCLCAALAIAASVAVAEARTCRPLIIGTYSDSQRGTGVGNPGALTSEAVGRQRAIAEWRRVVRQGAGVRYAVWSFARAKSATCRTSRSAGNGPRAVTRECRARALPCSAY
jgi:hypothetical protein